MFGNKKCLETGFFANKCVREQKVFRNKKFSGTKSVSEQKGHGKSLFSAVSLLQTILLFDREQSSKVLKEALLLLSLFLFAMEQKMFLEHNYGIEMPFMALYGRAWPCMAVYGGVWPCMDVYDIHQS